MEKPYIEASIHREDEGDYFKVKLYLIPREGELINLHSFANQRTGDPHKLYGRVTKISITFMMLTRFPVETPMVRIRSGFIPKPSLLQHFRRINFHPKVTL